MHLSLFIKAHLLTTCLHIFTKILHSLAGVQQGENNISTFCIKEFAAVSKWLSCLDALPQLFC